MGLKQLIERCATIVTTILCIHNVVLMMKLSDDKANGSMEKQETENGNGRRKTEMDAEMERGSQLQCACVLLE